MRTLIITGLLAAMSYGPTFAQTTEVLSGDLVTLKELDANVCYELDGCYRVLSGGNLTIPAGTQIRAHSQASLIVYQGGQIFANGTAANPVVFTSAQAVSSRAPGDWDGIYIAGYAVNNQGTSNPTKSCSGTITYGGSNDADNSGRLQYVRIEYAGAAPVGDPESSGLNLWSVGTGTTIDHVQVSYSLKNAYSIAGGKIPLNNLMSLNNYKTDLIISEGYTGNIQFLTSIRLDQNAHDNTGIFSNGIVISNDATGTTSTPVTHPVMSNLTFFGPKYCGVDPVHADFRAAIRLSLNAQAEIYNSVFTGWNTGLAIFDNSTIVNANVGGTILMADNTFYANTVPYANLPANFDPTGTGCASTITDWMDGSLLCSQLNNTTPPSITGYDSSLCGAYCTTAPTLTLAAINDVGTTNYSWDVSNSFDSVTYRGSLTATDWASGWFNACPQNAEYCSLAMLKSGPIAPKLDFVPNPSRGNTAIVFRTDVTGIAIVSILDKVSGKAIRQAKSLITSAGEQRLHIDVSDLNEGVYFVRVELSDRSVISGQLSVK